MTLRVVVLPPFDREFFGGADRLSIAAASLYDLIERLDDLAPGFADQAPARAAFAIDGVFTSDWTSPLADAAEVVVLPRVGGG
ncbi:MAG: MoaD/ThiS family protein [Novosphingobium sp.]|nr:MoaD/ThiS family protein [Novosphingobium sp.]